MAGGEGAVFGFERRLDLCERAEGAVERLVVVCGHHAGAEQSTARRHGGVQSDVHKHSGVEQRAPQQSCLPVVAYEHRHDRGDDVSAIGQLLGRNDCESKFGKAVAPAARAVEHVSEQLPTFVRADDA